MDLNKPIFQWLTLIILSLLWGTSFILMKKGLLALSPVQLGAMRISFAFLLFLPFALKRLKNLRKENIYWLITVGLIGNLVPAILFSYAETRIDSAVAGMINSSTTFFTYIIGILFYKQKVKLIQVLGILIGLIGTAGLVAKDFSSLLSGWNIYALLVVLATIFYGISTNIVKHNLKNLDGLSVSSLSFFFAGPLALIILFSTDLKHSFQNPDFYFSTGSVFVLAFVGSYVAIILFNNLIKHTSAVFAASVTYLIPFFAIFWGVLDGERLSLLQILAMFVVLFGVYLTNKTETASGH